MEQKTVLKIENLTKHLSSRLILNDISLEVKEGEIFGFLGPNGSGKTTTIKVMLGLLKLEKGNVEICGHDIVKEHDQAMECVSGIIENPEVYKYLTGKQNLMQYWRMYDNIPVSKVDEVAEIVGLSDRIKDKVSKYSLGMRQRLGLAQAMLNSPRLLVLDEPTNGLDPEGIRELRDILKRLAHEENVAVFISSHQLAELDLMCDRFAVIDRGSVIAVKSMEEVREANQNGIEQFEITTEENLVETASEVISNIGNQVTSVDGCKITVTANINEGGKALSETVRELVLAGVTVMNAVPIRRSLEDAFLEIIHSGTETVTPMPDVSGNLSGWWTNPGTGGDVK